jgi:hypothetical protein
VLSYESILAHPSVPDVGAVVPSNTPFESRHETRPSTVEERLSALKRLYEKGLINDAEYSEQKRRILDAL